MASQQSPGRIIRMKFEGKHRLKFAKCVASMPNELVSIPKASSECSDFDRFISSIMTSQHDLKNSQNPILAESSVLCNDSVNRHACETTYVTSNANEECKLIRINELENEPCKSASRNKMLYTPGIVLDFTPPKRVNPFTCNITEAPPYQNETDSDVSNIHRRPIIADVYAKRSKVSLPERVKQFESQNTFQAYLSDIRPAAMSGFFGVTTAALAAAHAAAPTMSTYKEDMVGLPSVCKQCEGCGSLGSRCHSDTHINASLSPILIHASHVSKEHSTEIVHPNSQQTVSLRQNKSRAISASLDDIHDSSSRKTLIDDGNHATCLHVQRDAEAPFVGHHLNFRTLSEQSNMGAKIAPRFVGYRDEKCTFVNINKNNHCTYIHKTDFSNCDCKKNVRTHAASATNIPGLPKKKMGIDMISYDFMRASGAIPGFFQLRSVKDIKQEREKQEISTALSSAINSSLDTSGAVASLAANLRPRICSSWIKRTIKGNSQDDTSLDSKSSQNNSNEGGLEDKLNLGSSSKRGVEQQSTRREDDFRACKSPSLFTQKQQDETLICNYPKTNQQARKRQASNPDEHTNLYSLSVTPKISIEDLSLQHTSTSKVNVDDEEEEISGKKSILIQGSERCRRPYYFQKAQQFRHSWRTHSVENPGIINHSLKSGRSLTMVESEGESEDEVGFEPVQVRVCAPNPIKTILVNHPNNNQPQIKRQKTFSNRNQWQSIQLSPSHGNDVEDTNSLSNEELDKFLTTRTREASKSMTFSQEKLSFCNKRCEHKFECACSVRLMPEKCKSNLTPLLTSVDYISFPTKKPLINPSKSNCKVPLLKQTSVIQSSEDKIGDSIFALRQRRIQAMQNPHEKSALHNVGYRLGRRKRLFEQRSTINDYSLAFAVIGIVLMIIESELTMTHIYTKDSIGSFVMKSLITCSTVALVGLIISYHISVVKILSFDDCIEDWRIAWDKMRVMRLIIEIIVCAIHPFPGNFSFNWPSNYYFYGGNIMPSCAHCQNGSLDAQIKSSKEPFQDSISSTSYSNNHGFVGPHVIYPSNRVVSIDIILSVPMFLRLYLIFRVVVLHSKLFTDTGSRSIGAMNKVSFNTSFIFKTFMTICPGTVLVAFILGFWLVLSWMLRACERVHDPVFGNIFNSMWLIAVTFLSIGYGDVVANTYCGRSISIVTGVLGSLCTALVVAVFARRLELSKAEKHVIHFMMENKLTKKMKYYAANVLRETWLIYKHTKLVTTLNATTIRKHQRKFLCAIHGLRQMKLEQRKLQDNANALVDLAKTQTTIHDTVTEMRIQHTRLQFRLDGIEESLLQVQEHFSTLPMILKCLQTQNRSYNDSGNHAFVGNGCRQEHMANRKKMRTPTFSSGILRQSTDLEFERDTKNDIQLTNVDNLDRIECGQFAVSFESTQSQKPCYSDFLEVQAVPRALSEPPSSFLAAVRNS